MINTKITINGTEHNDYQNLKVYKSVDAFNSAGNFIAILDSPFGRHANDFVVGEEVQIFADQDADPTTNIFTGVLEKVRFFSSGINQKVELSGRDYTLRLQDTTVEPVVYTQSEVSTIVTDIMNNNVPDITLTNVDVTTTTLPRIAFNHENAFDAIRQLADLSGFTFYVDEDKDLHFEEKQLISSGITLNNTNTIRNNYDTTRENMANSIWVYGDRQLTGVTEEINNNGSPWGGAPGSVFTLTYKPHNTEVNLLGSTRIGGVFGMIASATSGIDYLVSFEDRQVIFVSGTSLGYSTIPASGGSAIINYDREVPIVKFGENTSSIGQYGKKVKVINDKTIKDPDTALSILFRELEKGDPFRGLEILYKGWDTFTPGDTINAVLDDYGLNETDIPILSVAYVFDANTVNSEKVITVKLDKKINDITDEITDLRRRLNAIEAQDRKETDVITRLLQGQGSTLVVGSYWEVRERDIEDSFILQNNDNSIIGTSLLGDRRAGSYALLRSGGYSY